jgi:hypothetical protein
MHHLAICSLALFSAVVAVEEPSRSFCSSDACPDAMATPQEERTFIAIKPDAVQRGLVGDIIKRFEQRGFKLLALKMITASKDHLRVRYLLAFLILSC